MNTKDNMVKNVESSKYFNDIKPPNLLKFIEKLEKLSIKYFIIKEALYLYYKELGICKIKFQENSSEVYFEKIKNSKNKLIQNEFKYFQDFWTENIEKNHYDFNLENDRELMLFTIQNLIETFFNDLTIKFRLNEIEFLNYRSFKDEKVKLETNFSVLIGRNSSGKTSILDAAAVAIGTFLSGVDELTDSKKITKEDIRFSAKEVEGTKVLSHHTPAKIIFNTDFINNRYTWSRTRNSLNSTRMTTKDSNKIVNLVKYLVEEIRDNENREITLPVFSYHGTGRVANFTKNMNILDKTENISRFVGYKDCLKPASNYKFFIAWYSKMQFRAFTLNKRIPSLDAITKCLEKALIILTEEEELQVSRVLYLEGALHIEYENKKVMPISFLSDGYKDVIGIISDIAYRMAILNPHLGKSVLEKTNGVVLIDEIDIHLHPRWQQKIVYLLKDLFPNVQFIVATHSPIIVSTTGKNEAQELVLDENNKKKFHNIGEPNEWYISDILKNVFDLNQDALIKEKYYGESTLISKMELFSDLVKTYIVSKDSLEYEKIIQLYSLLKEELIINSPQRRAIDNLMGLIK